MTLDELRDELDKLDGKMDSAIGDIEKSSQEAQGIIYKYIKEQLLLFEIDNGRFVTGQDFSYRIAQITRKINSVLGDVYTPSLREYFNTYRTVEEINISLQKSYNQLEIDVDLLSPARKSIYNQAVYYLKEGLADAYVQPAKYLIMQQVTNGITLKDAQRILKHWNDGDIVAGSELTSGRATPNLTKYATQVARDSLYGYNGSINQIIAETYNLKGGIYVGDTIRDSRQGCKYLVGLKRKIHIDEIPGVIKKYPQGVKPNTTKENFPFVRMGYNCRHIWFSVRWRDEE